MRTIQPNVADAVAAADRAFFDTLLSADVNGLDDLLDPDFLIVDVEAGRVTRRVEFLDFVASAAVRFTRIEPIPGETIVRQFAGTVVVVGRTRMAFSTPGGTVTATSRYTHIFTRSERDDDKWLLASAQGTASVEQL